MVPTLKIPLLLVAMEQSTVYLLEIFPWELYRGNTWRLLQWRTGPRLP